jgi:hypothetical protein
MVTQEINFAKLMELFVQHDIPVVSIDQTEQAGGNLNFAVFGGSRIGHTISVVG